MGMSNNLTLFLSNAANYAEHADSYQRENEYRWFGHQHKYDTNVVGPAAAGHSIVVAVTFHQSAVIRLASITAAAGEVVQLCIIAAVSIHSEYDTIVVDPAVICHSVKCAAEKR